MQAVHLSDISISVKEEVSSDQCLMGKAIDQIKKEDISSDELE